MIRGVLKVISAFLRFLSFPIYQSGEHPQGWEKFAYDEEFVHYPILALLLEQSDQFALSLLGIHPTGNARRVVGPIPSQSPFDLELREASGDPLAHIEVKTWSRLRDDQFERQCAHLDTFSSGKGYYLLTAIQSREWPHDRIERQSNGRSRSISFGDVSQSLCAIAPGAVLSEFSQSYDRILGDLVRRTGGVAAA